MKKILLLTIMYYVGFFNAILAQVPNELGKIAESVSRYTQNKMRLSPEKLSKATAITYDFDNGMVPPEYHYDCTLTVYKNKVQVKVYVGYNDDIKYNESCPISSSTYKKFIESLAKQGISKECSDEPQPVGGGSEYIKVQNKNQTIFQGSTLGIRRINNNDYE